jgi:hypothetical protein
MTSTIARRLAIAFVIAAAPLAAQSIHPGADVRVRAPSVLLGRFEGVYIGRTGDTLVFGNDKHGPVKVPASAITDLDVSRGRSRLKGAGYGALWGAALSGAMGLLVVAEVAADGSANMNGAGAYLVMMAAGGAEIGAIVGAILGKRAWARAEPGIVLNAARIDVHHLGVQLALRF